MIYLQVAQLEVALATELKERSSLLETLNEIRQKMSEPESAHASNKESTLRIQVVAYLLFERNYYLNIAVVIDVY